LCGHPRGSREHRSIHEAMLRSRCYRAATGGLLTEVASLGQSINGDENTSEEFASDEVGFGVAAVGLKIASS